MHRTRICQVCTCDWRGRGILHAPPLSMFIWRDKTPPDRHDPAVRSSPRCSGFGANIHAAPQCGSVVGAAQPGIPCTATFLR